jgi:hypothetical protein
MKQTIDKFLTVVSNSISSMKTFFSIIVAMLVLLSPVAFAKRGAPAEVKPVVLEGIEYRAPHSTIDSNKMGVVEAWDKATGKMLWEKKVYTVALDADLEEDVQHVFITKLEIDAGKLIVTNERKDRYSIDLKTQKVTPEAANQSTKTEMPTTSVSKNDKPITGTVNTDEDLKTEISTDKENKSGMTKNEATLRRTTETRRIYLREKDTIIENDKVIYTQYFSESRLNYFKFKFNLDEFNKIVGKPKDIDVEIIINSGSQTPKTETLECTLVRVFSEYDTRVGYLPEFVGQHPIMAPMSTHDQFYFDIGEKPGSFNQIIVAYPKDMKIPTEEGRKIELKGLESSFSLGGKRGTKEGYGNRLLHLRSWKYVD